ncbi:hypothetical protein, partial [Pseudomonas sp. NBRC 111135]
YCCSFFSERPQNWLPCSKEHHDMVKANPHDWPGYEVREFTAIPADQVLVSRSLLHSAATYLDALAPACSAEEEVAKDLRAILHP